MNENTIHPSVSCHAIEAGDHDQIDKSLRCKINSEWGEREKEVEKKTRQGRMFVNKIAIVVKFHAAVKTESTCGCCFYRNLRVIGCFFFFADFFNCIKSGFLFNFSSGYCKHFFLLN